LEKRKPVDFLHTDAWRGEPDDIVNCVLYCAVSDKTSQLVVYDTSEIEKFENYTGPEKEAGFLIQDAPEIKFDHKPGEAIFFDAYTPHNTRRNGSEIRISLNFSFRRHDPYETLDEKWDRDQQPWGKYWYFPQQKHYTFEGRCNDELEKIVQSGNSKALTWRQNVINKLGIPRKLTELYA
jgi:ectoine hydroxylase-related dioxygenase (phytanoyl-CoA dioxygenase family)